MRQAFLNRPKVFQVQHEPTGDVWYFSGVERCSPRYKADQCKKDYPQHQNLTFRDASAIPRWRQVQTHPYIFAAVEIYNHARER